MNRCYCLCVSNDINTPLIIKDLGLQLYGCWGRVSGEVDLKKLRFFIRDSKNVTFRQKMHMKYEEWEVECKIQVVKVRVGNYKYGEDESPGGAELWPY